MDTSVSTWFRNQPHSQVHANNAYTLKAGIKSITRTVMWLAASSGLGRRDMAAWGFAGMDPGPIIVTTVYFILTNCNKGSSSSFKLSKL